jgi:hypothetical protein
MSTETLCEIATALEATEVTPKKPRWRLELAPEGLRGEREDGASFEIPRSELLRRVNVFDSPLARRVLAVRDPKFILQLEPSSYRELEAWLGKDLLLRMELRKRLAWVVPIGIILILGSLPLPADPAAGIEGAPLQLLGLVLGAILVVQGLLSRLRPDRIYLLLDSGWFTVLAVDTVLDVAFGASPFWTPVIALQAFLAAVTFRAWRRFGKMESAQKAQSSVSEVGS